jgi:hypothetical protein
VNTIAQGQPPAGKDNQGIPKSSLLLLLQDNMLTFCSRLTIFALVANQLSSLLLGLERRLCSFGQKQDSSCRRLKGFEEGEWKAHKDKCSHFEFDVHRQRRQASPRNF